MSLTPFTCKECVRLDEKVNVNIDTSRTCIDAVSKKTVSVSMRQKQPHMRLYKK